MYPRPAPNSATFIPGPIWKNASSSAGWRPASSFLSSSDQWARPRHPARCGRRGSRRDRFALVGPAGGEMPRNDARRAIRTAAFFTLCSPWNGHDAVVVLPLVPLRLSVDRCPVSSWSKTSPRSPNRSPTGCGVRATRSASLVPRRRRTAARGRRPGGPRSDVPDGSGFDLLGQIRKRATNIAVIILSSRDAEADRVAALETGADDYVTKPFSPREIVARVRAVLRRAQPRDGAAIQPSRPPSASPPAQLPLVVEEATRRAFVLGQEVELLASSSIC